MLTGRLQQVIQHLPHSGVAAAGDHLLQVGDVHLFDLRTDQQSIHKACLSGGHQTLVQLLVGGIGEDARNILQRRWIDSRCCHQL